MSNLELAIAWRYLRGRRGSRLLSFITVIAVGGVVVGVSALIVIMGVMNGLQHDLREKILIGSPDIRISTLGSELRMPRWREVLPVVREAPGVVVATPFVITPALVKREDEQYPRTAQLVGVDTLGPESVTSIAEHIVVGQYSFHAESDLAGDVFGIVLGDALSNRLQVHIGDTLVLLTMGSLMNSPHGLYNAPVSFLGRVNGIFHSGMYDYDNTFIYAELSVAQRLAALGTAVTGIEVRTVDRWAAPRVAETLQERLDPAIYHIEDWQRQNMALFSALKLEKLAMAIIVFLIVLVAAFNIVSVLSMLVQDKTREIGILRAMGMKSSGVRRVFLAQGIFIGLVGTTAGLIIGVAVSVAVGHYKLIPLDARTYFIDHLPVRTEPLDVILIVLGSMLIALLATLNPSSQAARLYPLEAIRHE